jgi:hypothetical protein
MTSDQPWWLTMPPAELAATILPLFSKAPYMREQTTIHGIIAWCKTGSYKEPALRGFVSLGWFTDPDVCAVAEAIQVLEHAGLLRRAVIKDVARSLMSSGGTVTVVDIGLTRLGRHALQANTVRQHLGLGDTTPPA